MEYYLCLNDMYDYHSRKNYFTKNRMYREKNKGGIYWPLYLINEQGNNHGVELENFKKITSIIPLAWIKLKNMCV